MTKEIQIEKKNMHKYNRRKKEFTAFPYEPNCQFLEELILKICFLQYSCIDDNHRRSALTLTEPNTGDHNFLSEQQFAFEIKCFRKRNLKEIHTQRHDI